jgi:tetratricopeptide (TPR) repeat protein
MKKLALIGLLVLGLINSALCQSADEQLATQYYQNKEYDKAIPYYEKIYSKNPTHYNYHNYLDCLLQIKDVKSAEKLIKKQIKQEPQNLVLWIDLGVLYKVEGDEKQEKEAYEKGIHNLTSDRDQILALGQAFVDSKEYDYALETYKKGKSLMKDQYPFLFEMGNVYKAQGNTSAMIDTYLDALVLSPSYIQSVQDALQISFGEGADQAQNTIIKKELLKYIQRYSDNNIFSELLIWMLIQQKDYDNALVQVKALDKRMHEGGWRVLNLARTCVANESYDAAIQAFQYVIDQGAKSDYYSQAKTEQLKAMNQKLLSGGNYTHEQLLGLQTKYKQALNELTVYAGTVQLMQDLAHLEGFYLYESDSAITLLNEAIAVPGISSTTKAYCQMELADVLVASGRIWEASLTYSKVEEAFKQDPLGEEARLKNAVVYFYTGNFKWAKGQLDVLKAATSKPTANDAMALSLLIDDNMQDSANIPPLQLYSHAMLLDFQNHDDSALIYLDSIGNMNATTRSLKEEVLMMRATIAIKKTDYTAAIKYYEQEIKDYPDGMLPDKALFLLAQLEEKKLNQQDKATDYYKQIILNYPGSFYVEQARDRYRHLSKTDAAPVAPIQ